MDFRILGPLEIADGGHPVVLRSAKLRVLLAALLEAEGRPVSPDRLTDALWPEGAPASASGTLQSHVSRLRTVIGSRITTLPAGYALDTTEDRVDAVEFERLAAAGREAMGRGTPVDGLSCLNEALALW